MLSPRLLKKVITVVRNSENEARSRGTSRPAYSRIVSKRIAEVDDRTAPASARSQSPGGGSCGG